MTLRPIVYAETVARDLGYRTTTRAFWRWCRRVGLDLLPDTYGFDPEHVRRAVQLGDVLK